MQIVYAILVFGLLVIVHELGHFLAAKAVGIKVNRFSVGLGPRLWGFSVGETDFAICALPFGGACIMEGEDENSQEPRAFGNKPIWARAIVTVAGSFMNFLLGLVVLSILVAPSTAISQPVVTGFPAELGQTNEGILVGDRIYSIDGERVYTASNISYLLSRKAEDHVIVVIRDGKKVKFSADLIPKAYGDSQTLRYGLDLAVEEATFGNKVDYVWNLTRDYVRLIRLSIMDLVTGRAGAEDLSGPVGITATLSQAASAKEYRMLWTLIAFIAINLAVMNLLPLPALDGGRLLFLAVETFCVVFHIKKLNPKYESYVHAAGLILFLGLMIFVTYNDIVRLIAK